MNLAEIKARREAEQTRMRGSTVLVWGPPRTGKTRWVSSIAKAPQIKKILGMLTTIVALCTKQEKRINDLEQMIKDLSKEKKE